MTGDAPPDGAPETPRSPTSRDTPPDSPTWSRTTAPEAPRSPTSRDTGPIAPESDGAPTGAAGDPSLDPRAERRERLRARIRAFQILLALGLMCAITGAAISVSVAFALQPAVR